MRTACIYHNNCFDGIAAAWVVRNKFPEAELVPANYGDNFPFHKYGKGDDIIIVDFSYPRDTMEQIKIMCNSILVLDHHKTAEKNCKGLPFCKFDMNESGASLAWKHFNPNEAMPDLIRYIADRDLWKFDLPDSEYINAYIQSFPLDVEVYSRLANQLEWNFHQCKHEGMAIERYKNQLVEQICKTAIVENIAGFLVPVANSPILMSEVGHKLADTPLSMLAGHKPAFGAYFFRRSDGTIQYGARSIGNFDVSEIAKKFGGGGHKNAAGWQFAREEHKIKDLDYDKPERK